jgi:DNA-binding MarR family transcriptional regulator
MTSIEEQIPAPAPAPAPGPAALLGPAVGQAEATLTRLLNIALAEKGIDRQSYLGLQRMNSLGQATRQAYLNDLREWLDLDATAASQLATELISAQLITADGDGDGDLVRLSAEGQALRADIYRIGQKTSGPVLAAIDPGDLHTTIRTLEEITRRVRDIPAGHTTEGTS